MLAAQVSVNRDTDDDVIMPGVGQEAGMVKRERFVTSVTCPVCALNGSVTWVENERGNLETTIGSLSLGFRTCPGNEVRCIDCGVTARIIGIATDTKKTG
jgi:Zn ribbon nucleic-acid-binding protein